MFSRVRSVYCAEQKKKLTLGIHSQKVVVESISIIQPEKEKKAYSVEVDLVTCCKFPLSVIVVEYL